MYTVGGREIEFVASEALFLQIARICLEANLKATEVGNVLSQTEVAPAHLAGHFRWQHLQLDLASSAGLVKMLMGSPSLLKSSKKVRKPLHISPHEVFVP